MYMYMYTHGIDSRASTVGCLLLIKPQSLQSCLVRGYTLIFCLLVVIVCMYVCMYVARMIDPTNDKPRLLKLKDWPTGDDFSEKLPKR